jgi:hypothetical protein
MEPKVLHFIICDRVHADPHNLHAINVEGLKWSIRSRHDPPFPFALPRLSCLLILMGGAGEFEWSIRVVQANPRRLVTHSLSSHRMRLLGEPLGVRGLKAHVEHCYSRGQGYTG